MIGSNIFTDEKKAFIFKAVVFFVTAACCLINWLPIDAMAHSWKAPKEALTKQNPVEKSERSINSGMKLYTQFCSGCHGKIEDRSVPYRGNSKTEPPDLVQRARHHSDGDFFWKIQHGRGEMPSFKDDLQEKEIWDIINYIKNLSK
jgi:mono/diheme cytochrome c family protein